MDKICKECKFWEPGETGWGSCKMGESKSGERLVKESKAYAEDYESYMAELITEADFGCCMFQEKNKESKMKCKYCGDKVYFSNDIQRWVHMHGRGENCYHCNNCEWKAASSRLLKACPVCGSLLKLNHIAYPIPDEEEKKA